jgi:hypothetical protein
MNERFEIRRRRKQAQTVALVAHVPFEAVMAVSTVALVAALAAALWQGLI